MPGTPNSKHKAEQQHTKKGNTRGKKASEVGGRQDHYTSSSSSSSGLNWSQNQLGNDDIKHVPL